ncbi:asparagine synthase (glutamine-hydrolyzing) [Bacillus sp. SLBN-46]|uniref:lasso peptide isopeptide bond-forming cyclase n=1 Tax=Bacillus sp. SLBN-46 TaxID=3042283 RepID=UPI002854D8F7|nr:lasso peptide isopeptide bond-forming cyclase [Bacillus sp. SLBN-46]MDR6121877.1 asparagine synthase (glutamine-hydrolyzing) [Bacillus sp. SLBN-46]
MSAIAGIYHLNNEPINLENGNRIMKELEKYPADDIQTWHNDKVFLGCHAQWITPESVGEKLPYYDHQRKLAITADAIIDNRDELFERLQVKKSDRKTVSDSELILLSYHKWGEESPKYLVGDFAFMIWDERKRKLFGAKDFSGTRTLYYFQNQKELVFCTTIHPILSLPFIEKHLNEEWLAEYLSISSVIDTADVSNTPYENIQQVPPSHSISVVGNTITIRRYCTLNSKARLKLKSNEEYVEAFQEVFQEAVKSRIRTYHQVGSHLSGGLDSGAVVSFAVKALREQNKELNTFSYIPPQDFKDFTPKNLMPDERPFIKSTVEYVGGIKSNYLDFEGRDSFSEIDDFLEIMEMPYKFFENTYWLKGIYEKAQEGGIGVLLNGGRGNMSISWGAALDYYGLLLKKFKWINLTQELHEYSMKVGGPRFRRLPVIARLALPLIDRIFPSGEPYKYPVLINRDFADRTEIFNKLKFHGMNESGWFSTKDRYELRKKHFEDVFHMNATNTLATKLSLRYSLWERDPTNDLRVVRFCLSLPEDQYVQNGMDRALVRRATKGFLPDKVRLNQHIRGVQGADWVHRMVPVWDTFISEIDQLCSNNEVLKYLNSQVIKSAYKKVKEGPRPDFATDPDYRILMRAVIVYRYLKNFPEGG